MVLTALVVMLGVISLVHGNGLLLLYRPKDITNDCAFSRHLRFDISYGMGMSDTITLVFRTLTDIDYECIVEIVTSSNQYLVVVVRYPTTIATNCAVNRDAVTVLKKWRCTRLCDLLLGEVYSPYFTFTVQNRLRFLFKSNSSINSDINANFYQVTVTSARKAPLKGCNKRNETICTVDRYNYCFTTGVVCDGIKNCGVDDWFDERKSQCTLPVERLGFAPVVAVVAALLCGVVGGAHALLRLLPPHANSFFVFNENEDNRLCVDPVLVPGGTASQIEAFERVSVIPVTIAVVAALLCGVVGGAHSLLRLLPPHANSFFVFNENEDNRLCVDPVLVPGGTASQIEAFERVSVIPVTIAVVAALLCGVVGGAHSLLRLLPPHANSFFVFNENEDNRLCVDPVLVPGGTASQIEAFERVSVIPVTIAVVAALLCGVVGGAHSLLRLLPPHANSFFVFNENEDNRLCVDPVLVPGGTASQIEAFERVSVIPVTIAVVAALLCGVVGGAHALLRLLPPHANSFFVFNENEDNRLCVDPVLVPGGTASQIEAFERVSVIPVTIAVVAALLCGVVGGAHALLRLLPPHANSFFVFNENEDNRLCVDPVLVPGGTASQIEAFERVSVIPVTIAVVAALLCGVVGGAHALLRLLPPHANSFFVFNENEDNRLCVDPVLVPGGTASQIEAFERVSVIPVTIAVVAALLCGVVGGAHALLRLLPPHANSFFVFNENEDNRLCVDPVLVPGGTASQIEAFERVSVIPVTIAVVAALLCGVVGGAHALLRLLPPHANSFFVFNENEDNRLCVDPVLVPGGTASQIEAFERVSVIPVTIAVVAALLCGVVGGAHALLRLLPPHANSFFVFNENEDNRLCVDPVLVPGGTASQIEAFERVSVIPEFGSISESENGTITDESQDTTKNEQKLDVLEDEPTQEQPGPELPVTEEKPESPRKSTLNYITEKIQKLMSVKNTGDTSRQSKDLIA